VIPPRVLGPGSCAPARDSVRRGDAPGTARARRARRGQATTEWIVLVSFVVVAVIAAGSLLGDTWGGTAREVGRRVAGVYSIGRLR
jgi:hypothetical protein